jgi:hypothetical protein
MTEQTEPPNPDDGLRKYLAQLPADQEKKVARIEEILRAYNSFDVVSWVSLQNLLLNPETYTEGSHSGSAANIEYIALQALRSPFNEGSQLIPGQDVFEEMDQLLGELFVNASLGSAMARAETDETHDQIDALRFSMRINEMFMRVPGYPYHQEMILREVFAPFAAELRRLDGFDLEDAIKAGAAIRSIKQDRLRERIRWARDGYRAVEQFVRRRRRGNRSLDLPPLPTRPKAYSRNGNSFRIVTWGELRAR